MTVQPTSLTPVKDNADTEAGPTLRRIGAVARMLHMPVATLRVWEQRYGLTQTRLSPSGQRLYATDDVQRLAPETAMQLMGMGTAVTRVLEFKDRLTGKGNHSPKSNPSGV